MKFTDVPLRNHADIKALYANNKIKRSKYYV